MRHLARRLSTLTLCGGLLLAACSEDPAISDVNATTTQPVGSGQGEWTAPSGYAYTLESRCGESWLIGAFEVEVTDHAVTEAVALDQSAESLLASTGLQYIPTIQELLDDYSAAVGEADRAEIEYDSLDGFPTRIFIDWDAEAIDDEACYTISAYTPLVESTDGRPNTTTTTEPLTGEIPFDEIQCSFATASWSIQPPRPGPVDSDVVEALEVLAADPEHAFLLDLPDPSNPEFQFEFGLWSKTDTELLVLGVATDNYNHTMLQLVPSEDGWALARVSFCVWRSKANDLAPASMSLAEVPSKSSTSVRLFVSGVPCENNQPPSEREVVTSVVENSEAVIVFVGFGPTSGPNTCLSNPALAVVVDLPSPLGDRPLLDGRTVPPHLILGPGGVDSTESQQADPEWPETTAIGVFDSGELDVQLDGIFLDEPWIAVGPGILTLANESTWTINESIFTNSTCLEWIAPDSGYTNETSGCLVLLNADGDQVRELLLIPRADHEEFGGGEFLLLQPVVDFNETHALIETDFGFFKVPIDDGVDTARLRGPCLGGGPKWLAISEQGVLFDFTCPVGA